MKQHGFLFVYYSHQTRARQPASRRPFGDHSAQL